MFKMSLGLEHLKNILVPSLFPSDEDGNPEDYEIDFFVNENDQLMITLESK